MWDWNRKEKLVICEVCGVGSEISPSVGLELMRYMLADYDQAMVGSEISPSVGLEHEETVLDLHSQIMSEAR